MDETIYHLEKKLNRLSDELVGLNELNELAVESHRASLKLMQAKHRYDERILEAEVQRTMENYRVAVEEREQFAAEFGGDEKFS
jgi:hypothetical protein